ncbi:MAG TPA: 3-hydroxyacyl-CoA dehydrogenase NAD-binding domain-containing protein, partial [Solirubrobacterales bacterium]|nr:3-hydroxyacyl-CoA dehydrogenase NAD-binding domain-containing protein [Solirubrobacterales bacterium]
MAIEKAAVIGGGTMGNGIAQVIAQSGIEVTLVDIDAAALTRATDRIKANLERLASREKISSDDVAATLGRLSTSTDLEEAGAAADHVVETVIEDFDVKSDVLSRLDKVCREDVILASNTSQFSITKLAATT